MELDNRQPANDSAVQQSTMQEYEVERIIDDTGSRATGNKKYLIRWKGYGEEDDTWEHIDNLVHCAGEVQDYELRQVGVHAIHDCEWDGRTGTAVFAVESVRQPGKAITLTLDMNGQESPQELLDSICKMAGVRQEDIVLAWASPLCETFSRANASNVSRGHHYRIAGQQWAPVEGQKGEVARQHDRLVLRVKEVLKMIGTFIMENPAGGLEKMWYMLDWESKKKVVELCAFIWPFRKTTNLWTQGIPWTPKGVTGNGRCNETCGQGSINPLTKRFKHFMALAVDPQRGPRGQQSTRMTCGIPSLLIREVLLAMAEKQQLGGKVVLDLCAGFQSIREEVLAAGATYVAVDIKGQRDTSETKPRRAAIVLCHEGRVMAVERRLADGGACWTVPGGAAESSDHSLHHTALRELTDETGLGKDTWIDRVRVGPEVIALRDTTYFAYALDPAVLQTSLTAKFGQRRKQTEMLRVAFISELEAKALKWRSEDLSMLKQLWGQPAHPCVTQQTRPGDVELKLMF